MTLLDRERLFLILNTLEKKLLRILYFLRTCRKEDLYLYASLYASDNAITQAYRRLLDKGFITDEKRHASISSDEAGRSTSSGGYHVTALTRRGMNHFIDLFRDDYYYIHRNVFTSEAGNYFSSYAGYMRKNTPEKIYAANRIRLLFLSSGIRVLPDEKPKLEQLFRICSGDAADITSDHSSFYLSCSEEEVHAILKEGIFYTMGEVRQYLYDSHYDGADQIEASRIHGIFISRTSCIAVYAPTADTNRMIKVNMQAERFAARLISETFSSVSDFRRRIRTAGYADGSLSALVVTNGPSLIQAMVMGHHAGKGHDSHEPDTGQTGFDQTTEPEDTYRYRLVYNQTLDQKQAEILQSGLDAIPGIRSAVTPGHSSCTLFVSGRIKYPKSEISQAALKAGITKISLYRSETETKIITAGFQQYRHIYAVNPDRAGASALAYLCSTTPEQYRLDRNKLIASCDRFVFYERDRMDLFAGSCSEFLQLPGEERAYERRIPVTFIPVCELKALKQISCDSDHSTAGYAIISGSGLEKLISSCIRKPCVFHEWNGERIIPVPDITQYAPDGFDIRKPRAERRKAPRRRKKATSIELDLELMNMIKKQAHENKTSMNRVISDAIRYYFSRKPL